MGAMPATQHMTAEEFLRLPDTDDLRGAELVEGELIVDPPRPLPSGRQAGELDLRDSCPGLAPVRRAGRSGYQLGVQLDERNVFEPDVLWYRGGRRTGSRRAAPVAASSARRRGPLALHLALRHRGEEGRIRA